MIKHILCITLLSLALTSCKKEKAPAPVPEPEAQGIFPNSPYTVSNATKFHGIFSLTKFTLFSVANHYDYGVSFYDTASANYYISNLVPVVSVRLNFKTVNLDTTFPEYKVYDISTTPDYGTETWQIQGANGIPSFNYTSYTDPKCANFATLPDSFNISTGVTFTLNITNVDAIGNHCIGLNDNSGHFTTNKPLQNGINVITFTNADLINLNPTSAGALDIMALRNTEVLNFYGKNFQFIKTRSYNKFIKIKP
jgi:hypothetical protein